MTTRFDHPESSQENITETLNEMNTFNIAAQDLLLRFIHYKSHASTMAHTTGGKALWTTRVLRDLSPSFGLQDFVDYKSVERCLSRVEFAVVDYKSVERSLFLFFSFSLFLFFPSRICGWQDFAILNLSSFSCVELLLCRGASH